MEKLSQILKDLEQGKISADHAEAQILDLFVVTKSVCEHNPTDFDVVTDTVVVCKCGHRWHG
jgi:hypothetical protein